VCIVDVKGMGFYMASCSVSQVWEGMEVQTNSPEIRQARRDIVELLLDNHPMDCQTCERDGNCELQNLAYSLGVRERHFEGERKRFPMRIPAVGRARRREVHPLRPLRAGVRRDPGRPQPEPARPRVQHRRRPRPTCQHGRLGLHPVRPVHQRLPHGRLPGEERHRGVWEALADPQKHVVVQTAPSIRAAIGEGFGLPPGTPATGKMVTALRRLGFDASSTPTSAPT
jgi:NADP-reducing hydrogenase subunit HndD